MSDDTPLHVEIFNATGTTWKLTVWGTPDFLSRAKSACTDARKYVDWFEETFSRFKKQSLLSSFSTRRGVIEVPQECTDMLHLYEKAYRATQGAVTPTIAQTLADAGYDSERTLVPQEYVRRAPPLEETVTIVDSTHIDILKPTAFDFGAIGKGYLVDMLTAQLIARGCTRFLVDGGGDIRYVSTEGVPIKIGLEDPRDAKQVIGMIELTTGALCGSATNRRRWGKYHHYIHPQTGESPEEIAAVWAVARTAAEADMITSCLFFTEPAALTDIATFEYCIVKATFEAETSGRFAQALF
ncbi:MAG: hypothetical protein RI911_301 [Candidatus Parcubacteria bacterium]|jgi:thiamine biosynthesis lipoprotein